MPAIQSFGFGRVTIEAPEETRDVIVLPERRGAVALHLTC
jgi:hypothetical protein